MVKKKAKPAAKTKKIAVKSTAKPKPKVKKKVKVKAPAKKALGTKKKAKAPAAAKSAKKPGRSSKKSVPKRKPAAKVSAAAAPPKNADKNRKPTNKAVASPPIKEELAEAATPVSPKKAVAKSPAPVASARPHAKGEVLPKQFLLELVAAVRDAVAPVARSGRLRQVVSTAPSGDATFELDVVAEKALLGFLRNAKYPVAYYSEDAGYSTFSSAAPKYLLVIDPIDGTRAAKNGFEGCTVSVACTRVIERPTMADLDNGCVAEILGDRVFYAERGKGIRMTEGGSVRRPRLSSNESLETLTWAMTVPARPAELIFPTAARLIDLSSLKGGFFACNSTSYSVTRLLTGQLDACVDFAGRYLKDIPECVEDYFINAGRGNPMGICPYDLAASLLIAREAGCIVTDAYGNGFDDVLLLDTSVSNQQSLIAAGNAELHKLLLSFFDTRIRQFENLLEQRASRKERQEP